jgi:Uncharacterized conserved protein (COG2071)
MKVPVLRGVIERRILVNYRVDPDVIARLLPSSFAPDLVGGYAMAGICLIRLGELRPRGLPACLGARSENAAHRIAVTWNGGACRGVYIPRRDTGSRLNQLLGGRLFPGRHDAASFRVEEGGDRFHVAMQSHDGVTRVEVAGRVARAVSPGSVFASLAEASRFFEHGNVGYSTARSPRRLDGISLSTFGWRIEPLEVTRVVSSFFEDHALFPEGSAVFDSAFVMRDIAHEWHAQDDIVLAA